MLTCGGLCSSTVAACGKSQTTLLSTGDYRTCTMVYRVKVTKTRRTTQRKSDCNSHKLKKEKKM